MPANVTHPSFTQPLTPSGTLWRYMNLPKYLSLIVNKSLYFSRSDRLGDPFEGSFTKSSVESLRSAFSSIISEEHKNNIDINMNRMSELRKNICRELYVNCWHMNPVESAAMWKLYSLSGQGVAITTTYEKLARTLSSDVFLGRVSYIDYDNYLMSGGNLLEPIMHKRSSFAHEAEVRAVIWLRSGDSKHRATNSDEIFGVEEVIDVDYLINDVYINPESPDWFKSVVENVSAKYGFNRDIKRSNLNASPIY